MVFFGTSEFAVPALRKLVASNFQITAVITQPDKPAGRKQLPLPSPVKKWAQENDVKVLQPHKLTTDSLQLTADVFIVASYGKIIPKAVLDIPQYGTLNIHPSLLPKYRGPSPIQTAILNQDRETGVTIIKLDEEMDHGPIIVSKKWKIENSTTYEKLHDKLAELGADLLIETLPEYIRGEIKPVAQDHNKVTFTKIITKQDGRIDWKKTAEEIDAQIRAFHVWPVAWTTLDGKRLKIYDASIIPSPTSERVKGEVTDASGTIKIQTGNGVLSIKELQLEGGKRLTAQEFINGQSGLERKILL